MDGVGPLIFRGAEAELRAGTYLGLGAVAKQRVAKAYRLPALDAQIRRERTRSEAHLLAQAHRAGIRVPHVLDVDVDAATLLLEHVPGPSLRERLLQSPQADGTSLCRDFGRIVGRLHAAGLTHGDLTTSNVIVGPDGLVLIDFGLSQPSAELEDRGVDLHLVERTFESSHPERPELLDAVLAGYGETFGDWKTVFARVEDIKARGRYT